MSTVEDLLATERLKCRIHDAVVGGNVTPAAVEAAINSPLEHPAQAIDKKRHMPVDGEVFEVTHDFGDNPKPDELPNRFEYRGKWRFDGKVLAGKQTRKFKWVCIGPQRNLDIVHVVLAEHGTVPEGQWLEAIREQFEPNGWRGIADASWVSPSGCDRNFPYLGHTGVPSFNWAGSAQGADCRWLVVDK